MKIKMVAKNDIVMHDIFEQPYFISRGEMINAENINGIVKFKIHGLTVEYDEDDIQREFVVKECD